MLGAALLVVPTSGSTGSPASWAVIIGVTAGVAHFVASAELIRGRRWGASLVGYLAAAGIAAASFAAILAATGHVMSGRPEDRTPSSSG